MRGKIPLYFFIMNQEKRLFIIDDETTLLVLLQDYLEQFDLKVFVYEAIPDLENELKEKAPQAILLDIFMPQVSGIDILKKIKTIDSQIPVIMMTGYADETMRIESLRNGAYALLSKPFHNLEEVYHNVNNAMSHYLEMLRTKELSAEVEERYKREKMNLLELDFLKDLQHMIGQAGDPAVVLKNAYMLLKNFLNFEYFAVLLLKESEINIQVYPNLEKERKCLEYIASTLLKSIPYSDKKEQHKVLLQGNVEEISISDSNNLESLVLVLSTPNKVYGYAGLFRKLPFDAEEEHISNRFCSHIAFTLEKIRLFDEIRMLSIRDGLTGIFNHAYIVGDLEQEIERVKRYNTTFSVILIDIDNFKRVNNSYGHLASDVVLKQMAEIMLNNLRIIDIVGRYGGEEFLIILPETDLERAIAVSERLRMAVVSESFLYNNTAISSTISLGIATYREGKGAQDLIKIADDNLYKAKTGGKNRIYYEQ